MPLLPSRERRAQILALALPIIGGMTSQNLLNLADAWMVGGLGPSALAATGMANFVNFIANAAVMGVSPAVQAIAARRIGEGRDSESAAPLNGGLLLSLLIGVPVTLLLIALAPWLFAKLNHDPDVIRQGVPYLRWRMLAVTAVGMNFSFRGYWSASSRARFYMLTLVFMHVLNVIFSYTLIHGLFGFPELGTTGAGIGTTLSIFCGTALYFWLAGRHALGGGFLQRWPTREEFGSLLRLGIPSAIQQLLFSGGFVVLFWIVGKVGTAELAVANVLVTIALTAILPGMGLGIAAATLVSQALGRKDAADAHRWSWDVYRTGCGLFLALALPMVFFPSPVLALFVREPALVALGRLPLQLVGAMILLDGLGLVMLQALLGAGASGLVMIVSVALQWGLFLPLAYVVGPVLGYGLLAIWLAMGLYRVLQTTVFTLAWERRGWAQIKV